MTSFFRAQEDEYDRVAATNELNRIPDRIFRDDNKGFGSAYSRYPDK
jgi:hypothetical protein